MKRTIHQLVAEQRKRLKQDIHLTASDFERISHTLSLRHIHLRSSSLRKLWEIITGRRRLSEHTLNRLALFAGFQDWQDLEGAIHGEVDASVNYKEESLGHALTDKELGKKKDLHD